MLDRIEFQQVELSNMTIVEDEAARFHLALNESYLGQLR